MNVTLDLPTHETSHPLRRRWLGTPAYWACQALGWGGVGFAVLGPLFLYQARDAEEEGLLRIAIANRWVFLTLGLAGSHLLRVVLLGILRKRRSLAGFALAAAPWLLAIPAVQTLWIQLDMRLRVLGAPRIPPEFSFEWSASDLLDDFTYFLALAVIWCGFYIGIRYFRQQQRARLDHARLEAAARESELRALKAQLNPHFLFNSLNSLRALIPFELERPREAVTRLADLLRASLASGRETLVPLRQELETVENYLALEQLRHEDLLRWRIDADPAAAGLPVPPFLVQSLVENAVKHGISRDEAGGEVIVEASLAERKLRIRVTNPGTLGAASGDGGFGLANIRARLDLLFGPAATFTLRQAAPGLVEAVVVLPAQLHESTPT